MNDLSPNRAVTAETKVKGCRIAEKAFDNDLSAVNNVVSIEVNNGASSVLFTEAHMGADAGIAALVAPNNITIFKDEFVPAEKATIMDFREHQVDG
ncbi:hypothetical protein NKI25_31660 [Mesorhizobium sp. M0808]|uniref:hypothetical protein n=1 Tax=Mesorhizobium sp. M0808 TaxID=2957002 RepID=UPI003335E94B